MKNLTVVIVTFSTDKDLLIKCVNSISKKSKILIIENSKNFIHKKFFLDNYSNIEIFCTNKNLGYGGGNNFGLKKVKTDFALILNPDVTLNKDFFFNIKDVVKNNNFSLIGCQNIYEKIFMPAGYFKKNKDINFRKQFKYLKRNNLIKVDWITGCSMLMNMNDFKQKEVFDSNFFLYFEEIDLCMKLKKLKKNVFLSRKLKIHHLGFKSSSFQNLDFHNEAKKLRSWHWMWSFFYYHKKNYGYFVALTKSLGKLFKSFFKSIFYSIIFDQVNRDKYLYRFLGLFYSILGLSSFYRGKYFK